MKRLPGIWICLLALAMLSGCSASNMGAVQQTESGAYKEILQSNNSMLLSRLKIADMKVGHAGDLMRAQVTLENRWKFKLDFQYKFKWFDKNGFEISPDGRPWTPIVMPGRNQLNVQATAPNPTATRFEVWVQE